ncbi:MAG: thermonuclease family protein [Alphaproteobacteria bacterium]
MRTVTCCLPAIGLALFAAHVAVPRVAVGQSALDPYETVEGLAEAVEGDIVSVNGVPVRLYGIDAPDTGQSCETLRGRRYDCGAVARAMLDRLVGGNPVRCTIYSASADGSQIGACFVGRHDLGAAMVLAGWAFSQRSLSNRYERHEARAQSVDAGLWAGRARRP